MPSQRRTISAEDRLLKAAALARCLEAGWPIDLVIPWLLLETQ